MLTRSDALGASKPAAHAPAASKTAGSAAADLAIARRVVKMESEGLAALAESLDESFSHAVELLFSASGRIIVTGMGKSGHIACKIAATLASTGTKAMFVHPAEASHGDLGMISTGDAVIALSNSGETAELTDIIAYTKRFRIPLIAVTRGAESMLVEAADASIVLPPIDEACPLGLAPTTSTTMMLALGDAIAVALLERRAFSPQDFRVFHPGGQLGRKLLRVSDIMHGGEATPLVGRDTAMAEAILVMTARSLGCVGVIGPAGRLEGVVTDGDLRRNMSGDLLGYNAAKVMNPAPKTIAPTALAAEALGVMNGLAITSLFVVDPDGRPLGVVHIHDCLRAGVA